MRGRRKDEKYNEDKKERKIRNKSLKAQLEEQQKEKPKEVRSGKIVGTKGYHLVAKRYLPRPQPMLNFLMNGFGNFFVILFAPTQMGNLKEKFNRQSFAPAFIDILSQIALMYGIIL